MFIEYTNNGYFHLKNEKISYVIQILDNGYLSNIYFGKSLTLNTKEDYEYLSPADNKPSGAVKYENNKNLSLSGKSLELPIFGRGDFKEGALALERNQEALYLDLKYDGYEILEGMPEMENFPHARNNEKAKTLKIDLKDNINRLQVSLYFGIYEKDSAIVKSIQVTNLSKEPLQIRSIASSVLNLPYGNYEWLYLKGNWAREFQIGKMELNSSEGIIESRYGASSHKHNPFTAFVNKDNENIVYTTNIIYSGNFQNKAQSNEFGMVRMISGINPATFTWTLKEEESFTSPQAYHIFSDKGFNEACIANQNFVNDHIVNPYWQGKKRPVVLNSWEALYFNLNHENILEQAAKGKEIGVDCYVVDDGWFGHRDDDRTSLGDWFTDTKKFPLGIEHTAKAIHDMGLQFGLWFEPEMVNEDSDFYRAHPEFVVRPQKGRYSFGRGQLVLDFTNPECVDAIYAQMKKVIEKTQLDYIKWDMNRDITEAFSCWLAEYKISQKEFYHRYICGVYSLYEKILKDFPHILIEGCASGGGRFDAGILYYSPQIWVSDNTDAIDRQNIQYGCSLAYPMSCMSNHVSAVPNHQTFRNTSLKEREDTALFGVMGLELDLMKVEKEELYSLKEYIDRYKKMQPLMLTGSLVSLSKDFQNNSGWKILCAQSKDQKEYVLGFYYTLSSLQAHMDERVLLPNIKNEKIYSYNDHTISGSVLNGAGLRLPVRFNGANGEYAHFKGDFQSDVYTLKESRN